MCEGKDTEYRYRGKFFDRPFFRILVTLKDLFVITMDVVIGFVCLVSACYIVPYHLLHHGIASLGVTNGLLLLIVGHHLIFNIGKK